MASTRTVVRSDVVLEAGNGKTLFAVAVEKGWARIPDILYFAAATIEDVRVQLLRGVLTLLPKGSKIVGVAPAVGSFHDERGDNLTVD